MAVVRPYLVKGPGLNDEVTTYAVDENVALHSVLYIVHNVTKATDRLELIERDRAKAVRMRPFMARSTLYNESYSFHAKDLYEAEIKAETLCQQGVEVHPVDELAVLVAMDPDKLEQAALLVWPYWGRYDHEIKRHLPEFEARKERRNAGKPVKPLTWAMRLHAAHCIRLAMELPAFGPKRRNWSKYGGPPPANDKAAVMSRHQGNVPDTLLQSCLEAGLGETVSPFEPPVDTLLRAVARKYGHFGELSAEDLAEVWNRGVCALDGRERRYHD